MDIGIALIPQISRGLSPLTGGDGISRGVGCRCRSVGYGEGGEHFRRLLGMMINAEGIGIPGDVTTTVSGDGRESLTENLFGDGGMDIAGEGEADIGARSDTAGISLYAAVLAPSLFDIGLKLNGDLSMALSKIPNGAPAEAKVCAEIPVAPADEALVGSMAPLLSGGEYEPGVVGGMTDVQRNGAYAGDPEEGIDHAKDLRDLREGNTPLYDQPDRIGSMKDIPKRIVRMNDVTNRKYYLNGLNGDDMIIGEEADPLPVGQKAEGGSNFEVEEGFSWARPYRWEAPGVSEVSGQPAAVEPLSPFEIAGDPWEESLTSYGREPDRISSVGGLRRASGDAAEATGSASDNDTGVAPGEAYAVLFDKEFGRTFDIGSDSGIPVQGEQRSAAESREVDGSVGSGRQAPEWISHYKSDIIDRMAERITFNVARGKQRVMVELEPESLGRVEVILVSESDSILGYINVEESIAGEIIERSLPELRQALIRQGLPAGDFQLFQSKPEMMMSQFDNPEQKRGREPFEADMRRAVGESNGEGAHNLAGAVRSSIEDRFRRYSVYSTIDVLI